MLNRPKIVLGIIPAYITAPTIHFLDCAGECFNWFQGTYKTRFLVKSGSFTILEAKVNHTVFILVNIYFANLKIEPVEVLSLLIDTLESIEEIQNKDVAFGGDTVLH